MTHLSSCPLAIGHCEEALLQLAFGGVFAATTQTVGNRRETVI